MGTDHFENVRVKVGRVRQFDKQTFEEATTYENYFHQHQGSFSLNQGNGAELQLTIPGGNYEIEAFVRLYNNSSERIVYSCSLEYYLDNYVRDIGESGELASTLNSKPYIIHFKTLSTFQQSRVIKFTMGGAATMGFLADQPMLMVRRIGAIWHTHD